MALGRRRRDQQDLWVATCDLPKSPGHRRRSIRCSSKRTQPRSPSSGVIVPDEPMVLPEGAEIAVSPTSRDSSEPTWAEAFKDLIVKTEGLSPDIARNHDHFIHGAPKR